MRRIINLLFLLLFVAGIQAQTNERQGAVGKFHVIPSIMLTYNPYSLKDLNNNDVYSKYNFQYGLGIETEYRFHEVIGVSLGVNYMVQGVKTSEYQTGAAYSLVSNKNKEGEVRVKSLGVPLIINVHPLPNDRLTLKAGIEKDILLGMGDEYKSTCTDFVGGVAFTFDDKFQLELRYNSSLSKITKDKENGPLKECFVFSFGVIF